MYLAYFCVGFLTPDDLQHLLEILDPETFAVNRSTETEGWKHGLIALAAQEPIKLQVIKFFLLPIVYSTDM